MQKLHKNRKSEGFTIIEVLIVLAIAGLIMVVVFLAVPALQRSGRNNALNTDTNNILSAVGEFVSNNGGALPTGITPAFVAGANTATLSGAAGTNPAQVKLGGNIQALSVGTTATVTSASAIGSAQVVTGNNGICNPTGSGLGVAGSGSTRSYAILYVAEGANGSKVLKCQGS